MKRKNIRIICTMILGVLLLFSLCTPVFALDENDIESTGEEYQKEVDAQYESLLDSSGANELYDTLPPDTRELLNKSGIDGVHQNQLMSLSFFDIVKTIFTSIKENIKMPLSMLCTCLGVILLCALLNSMKSGFQGGAYDKTFSVVSVICVSGTVITPITVLIVQACKTIEQASGFLVSFVPVYAGILTASGKPLSATATSTALVAVVQIISRICSTVLLPMLGIYLAFCLIGSACDEIDVTGIARAVKNIVTVTLSFLLTIFVGLLGIQGAVASSADTIAMKSAKFAVSAFLPVVGGAVSEALNSVQGCMGVIKATVGGFGIFAISAVFLPAILSALGLNFSLFVAGGVSDTLNTTRVSKLLEAARAVLSLLSSLLVIFAVLLIVSMGVMLAVGKSA